MPIMHDGLGTLISFENSPGSSGVVFKEVSLKPFGFDGRGPIDTTSLRNIALLTKQPKQLADVTSVTGTFQWDPALYSTIYNLILQVNQLITLQFPNGEIFQFYGWLDKFDPQEHKEGELPLANITIEVSNTHPTTRAEVAPVRIQ